MQRLDGIQVLRGLAALAVALFHFHTVERLYGPDALVPQFAEYGRAGVDLFFVISGFIMVRVAGRAMPGPVSAGNFLAKRMLRIYPPYWVATLGVLAVWIGSGHRYFGSFAGEAPDIAASLALLPQAREPILNVGWTLVHEMYFYIVFALLLLAPVRWRGWLGLGWLAVILGAGATGFSPSSPAGQIVLHPLTLEFILGAGIAVIRPRFIGNRAAQVAGVLAALWFAGAVMTLGPAPEEAGFADGWRRAACFGPAAAALVFAVAGPSERPRWPRPLVALGDASFALYLIHLPLFAVLGIVWGRFAGPGLLDNAFACLGFVSVAIIAAFAFYRLVEQPMLAVGHRSPVRRRAAAA
ncbi:MAG: acyltransferase [Hyphomonas sp.]|nr:acyltransferase [Hyphomonas sp.]MCB9961239.1 acyltransferase [Hyphomonas sp.]MCB9970530.1 acyltransferase [Hyphomonas sp.]